MYLLLMTLVRQNSEFLFLVFDDPEMFQHTFLPSDDLTLFMYQLQLVKLAIGQPDR